VQWKLARGNRPAPQPKLLDDGAVINPPQAA